MAVPLLLSSAWTLCLLGLVSTWGSAEGAAREPSVANSHDADQRDPAAGPEEPMGDAPGADVALDAESTDSSAPADDATTGLKGSIPARSGRVLANTAVRKVAFVVGANDGGSARARLRYATSDASAMARVLEELADVQLPDVVRLDDPTPDKLRKGFEALDRLVAERGAAQFIFYYSGHSDEQGLLLGEQRVTYRELRKLIDSVHADVRIAILDSCASGAFTRLKGGTRQAPFMVAPIGDVKGHAFLTSSSEDEAAQESDRIGGSFFTHYLTTGLRGAADQDGDKLVTLSEAYAFAFEETLMRTQATQGGPQHAAYEISLSGTGDLVMTDLRNTTGRLELASGIHGRVSIRAAAGYLVAELYKPSGTDDVLLALEPGRYQVTVDDDGAVWRTDLTVPTTDRVILAQSDLRRLSPEGTVTRGVDEGGLRFVRFDAGVVPALSTNALTKADRIRNTMTVGLVWTRVAQVDGASIALGLSIVDERLNGIQAGFVGNVGRGITHGMQVSAFFNSAEKLSGVQFAQANHAASLDKGAQVGFVNHVRTGKGTQIGFINAARRFQGAQIGFISVAEDADAQIGVFTATRKGNVHPEVWTSDTAVVNLGLRFPARYTYTMLAAGVAATHDKHEAWLFGFGFGVHLPLPAKATFDIDLLTSAVSSGLELQGPFAAMSQLRLLIGYAPFGRFAFFGGPSIAAMLDRLGTDEATPRPGYPWTAYRSDAQSARLRIWVGFAGGLRF